MRAHIFGGLRLEAPSGPVTPPSGRVGTLLRWLLVHPNETHGHGALTARLWPHDDEADRELARDRLYVVVSRLRRFLRDGDEGGLHLVTDGPGYRLEAGASALDRVAFESAARRALRGQQEAIEEALALWRGEPYQGFVTSDEIDVACSRLQELHRSLVRLRDGDQVVDDVQWAHARTKVLRPRTPPGSLIVRQRLLDRLGRAGQGAVLAVVAPAGFGKSLLLSQWAQRQVGPVGWVTLEASDDDPLRFWSAIQQGLAEAGAIDATGLPDDASPGSTRFLEALAASVAAAGSPVGLVLDDAHHLANHALLEHLATLATELRDHFTIAIGSRLPVGPALDGRLDRDAVRTIGAADLRFDADEVAGVVRTTSQRVDVDQLLALTEGWPLPVSYLSRLGIALPGIEVAASALEGYVIDEVQQTLPAGVGDFLLDTAHLERLSVGLCDAVRGSTDAEEHLGWLREHQLFVIEVASDTGWYRYHHLVRGVLRRLAVQSPAVDVPAGHRRAAAWYANKGMLEDALEHAVAGEDEAMVADLTGDVLWSLASRNEVYTIRRWLHRIDPAMLESNRGAHDLATIGAAGWLEPEQCERWVASRRRRFGDDDLMASLATAHTAYLQGRARECIELNEQSLAAVDAYFAAHPSRPGVREATTGTMLASRLSARILAGDVHHDDPELAAMAEMARTEIPLMALWVIGEWAFLAWVEGARELAADLVAEVSHHLASMDAMSTHLGAGRLLVAQALVESDRVDDRQARQRLIARLTPMIELYRQLRWDVELVPVLLALHGIEQRGGDPERAAGWLDEADVLLGLCPDAPLMVRARAELTGGWGPDGAPSSGTVGEPLTERERTVLAHLERGLTYDAIAERLGVSPHTVGNHLKRIYRKLGVRTRHGAVRLFRAEEGQGS